MLQTHACDGRCFPSWRPERFGAQGDGRLQHGVANEGDVTLDQERLAADVVEVAELGSCNSGDGLSCVSSVDGSLGNAIRFPSLTCLAEHMAFDGGSGCVPRLDRFPP